MISTGTCGAFRAWHCNGGLYVQTCLYDQNENLVGQRYCGDTPQPCAAAGVQLGAQETCALKDVLMPETGCASAGSDGGVDCCGDGHLSPAGPPFNCAAREDERAGPYCRYVGSCGQVVSIYGFSSVRSCYYDAAGTLIYATRSEQRTTQGPYCGQVQITSAWLGSGDASQVSSCGTSASRTSCLPSTDAGTD